METLIILIVIFVAIIVVGVWKTDVKPDEPGHKRHRSSSDHPKSLPWFDKDYQRKRKKKKRYFWDD
jgi:hypothetical protein